MAAAPRAGRCFLVVGESPEPYSRTQESRILPAAFAGAGLLEADGKRRGNEAGPGGGCSDGRVGNARLVRAGRKLQTGPGKFQRKTKPDELFKGFSLSALICFS